MIETIVTNSDDSDVEDDNLLSEYSSGLDVSQCEMLQRCEA